MNLILKNLTTKPSFFFLAYQGIMFLATAIVGFCISGIYQKWSDNYLIIFFVFTSFMTSFVTLYTCITYFTFQKKRDNFFNFFFILIHVIIYAYFYTKQLDIIKYGGSGVFALVAIPTNILAFTLFTLIPYMILIFVERKRNLIIKTPSYCKNKLYLYTTIVSILTYICANLFCIGFLIFAFFKALSDTY